MAHCRPALLDDIRDVLDEVRRWAGAVEKKPGVFYVRRQPFLHFHLAADGRRRADVKGRAGWISLELPRPISARRRQVFRRELRRRYAERGGSKSSGLRGRKSRSKASHSSFE
jgi:hypothetical protein